KKPGDDCTRFHVLVGLTGSVAALKAPLLAKQLLEIPVVEVRVVTTDHATHFYDISEVPVRVYTDKDEWEMWTKRSDPVLHIVFRRWADLLVIGPLDANTLGKIASGICNNLLTCVVRTWDPSRPLLFCPAMNTTMWQHPITAQQVATLKLLTEDNLILGVFKGKGPMAEVSTNVDTFKQYIQKHPE
uniref:Phosphopantothenoylcysteine decarboxylase n=1 Tax=Cyprinus carpio TaxID=7962 RepID=A0A8C2B116_CYPCA